MFQMESKKFFTEDNCKYVISFQNEEDKRTNIAIYESGKEIFGIRIYNLQEDLANVKSKLKKVCGILCGREEESNIEIMMTKELWLQLQEFFAKVSE